MDLKIYKTIQRNQGKVYKGIYFKDLLSNATNKS